MLDGPQVPVVHHGTGQQNTNAASNRTQHRKPLSPTVNRFHRGVKAHGPTPEQSSTL